MARKLAAVIFAMAMVHSYSAYALGLGELKLQSFLNEPLLAEVDLLNTHGLSPEQIRIRLATKEDFDRLGTERSYFLTSLKFDVEVNASGRGQITITSPDPVLEPYLDFIVEARWPDGRLLREYTVLVDPPAFDSSTPVISAVETIEKATAEPSKKNTEASTGTVVSLQESSLAAGTMPARNFGSDASPTAKAGERYLIRRDETLWGIAERSRPEGVSVHQAMLDIQRLNPDAFIDGNINRIKAGYVIYLPARAEISPGSDAAAAAEVAEQNKVWQQTRGNESFRNTGPSLRISAQPSAADQQVTAEQNQAAVASGVAQGEDFARLELERDEMAQRLAALEEQLATLQSIVSIKDEQIAALQTALSEQGSTASSADGGEILPADVTAPAELAVEGEPESADRQPLTELDESTAAAVKAEAEDKATVVAAPPKQPVEPAAEQQTAGGLMDYLWHALAALAVLLLGLFAWWWRGRKTQAETEDDEQFVEAQPTSEDVFADVELQDHPIELDAELNTEIEAPVEDFAEAEENPQNRGYGQLKHDEYASDVETGDALAEADIYIAYGRYPQAIDLLRNAIEQEPNNPAYRLKLLEVSAETGDSDEVERQSEALKEVGSADMQARAEEVVAAMRKGDSLPRMPDLGAELEDLTADTGEVLEADFSGLEIEEDGDELIEDDLDLSADFGDPIADGGFGDDELVIATEGNEMSTKLDLARAYLDMGDDDGAKLILEEVVNEGSGEQQQEARSLLERLG